MRPTGCPSLLFPGMTGLPFEGLVTWGLCYQAGFEVIEITSGLTLFICFVFLSYEACSLLTRVNLHGNLPAPEEVKFKVRDQNLSTAQILTKSSLHRILSGTKEFRVKG